MSLILLRSPIERGRVIECSHDHRTLIVILQIVRPSMPQYRSIADSGGRTRRNPGFRMGHSAGGAHVASYAYDRSLQPEGGSGLAGVIVVSGRVRVENRTDNPNARRVETYYSTTSPDELDRLSPVSYVGPNSIPTLVAWGEHENPLIDVH